MKICNTNNKQVTGEFVTMGDERFYAINNVNKMAPFFVSVISNSDHWLFVSSTGGLTAGRVSPETALFPYITVDRIHESDLHTGCKTLLRVNSDSEKIDWEPFNREHELRFDITRNLYKNVLGNKLCFEEIHNDLQLAFRYTWATSDKYGFVRQCELENLSSNTSDKPLSIELIDGFQNILPAGTPRFTQTNSSNLVDAYKWTELDESSGLAFFTLFSGITDRAEPCESLKTNTVFCLGLDNTNILLSSEQLAAFRSGEQVEQELTKRGIRGAFLVNTTIELAPNAIKKWQLVANVEQSQSQSVALRRQLNDGDKLSNDIQNSIANGSDELARIMASVDGFQLTGEESVSEHHYANVLFNTLRGGVFDDQYMISSQDFSTTIDLFNHQVYQRNQALLDNLPEKLNFADLLEAIKATGDSQLERLSSEYLPISFGRRHGDPSRPWNQFAIKLVDENNNRLLTYQGNWRDIFQNWEALTYSYPQFIESVVAKFVNASTMDGYNPYRITKEGIDWEVEEPDDPWSYIGYWGDHQIIYLQKMLELSNQFHPDKLSEMLRQTIFSYANVPYRIKSFDNLVENAKSTVTYDEELSVKIEQRVETIGADGKLVLDANGDVYQVNLLEKLLVPLLSKLGNLVIDGGIWLNTQRPEWNDANNALVGQGLSMVTLCYLRRYICFFQDLLANESQDVMISVEVNIWLLETAAALNNLASQLTGEPVSPEVRYQSTAELGMAASHYRETIYKQEGFSGQVSQKVSQITSMLKDALQAIEHTIETNERADGLYNAYNLLSLENDTSTVKDLYPMLEGQVAALSSGALKPQQVVSVVEALFASDVYRPDQNTFMLYPDRKLPSFLEKNCVCAEQVQTIALLQQMLEQGDEQLILQDVDGEYRFNAQITNSNVLAEQLTELKEQYPSALAGNKEAILALYEQTFNHQAFTGRSGGMFGFEGLGCIYWHMVSKLLIAVEENFFTCLDQGESDETTRQMASLYYRVRDGIGFNKTPQEYGAFPMDPYSHTPKHAGAQQPGMTGQVKEEILSRFGELGVRVKEGQVSFMPNLLQSCEFIEESKPFRYLDVDNNWQEIIVPAKALAFTWCQVPIVYQLNDEVEPSLIVTYKNGEQQTLSQLGLPAKESSELFLRSGQIQQLTLTISTDHLFY
ncbi:hypothetical protein [Candidatus Colwellia aromaticivorans]|uniref:hypothetical protein n=1 Tax=Candidatus Colwellia aromaticivorans TaxID=2267621 RepID=UPI000DF48C94|nr:hypothetical protein [Candidatus Colwellia aromaticivorans]